MATMTLEQAMQLALQHHRAGRLADAEALYRQVLAVQPAQAQALRLLGVIAHQAGRNDSALELIRRAIAIEPGNAAAHADLGAVFRVLGRAEEATVCYRRASELQPRSFLPYYSLGLVLHESGRLAEAAAEYEKALEIHPALVAAHNNLGVALKDLGRHDEAIERFRTAIRLQPDYPEAHNNLGMLWTEKGDIDEALVAFGRALASKPDYAEAHNNLGIALRQIGRADEALASFGRALQINPSYAEPYNNLAETLVELGRTDEAIAALRQALACKKEFPEVYRNLGSVLARAGRLEEALAALRQALALRPEYAEALANLGGVFAEQARWSEAEEAVLQALEIDLHCPDAHRHYAFLLLLRGDFERGWPMYELRGSWLGWSPDRRTALHAAPRWDGAPLHGERVLLLAEQGLGDAIHFVRYAEFVGARGGEVILQCELPLVEIFRGVRGAATVLPVGAALPAFGLQAPLLSLPLIFRTTAETIPQNVPYLFAEASRREEWRKRFPANRTRYRVGLAWAGGAQNTRTWTRNVPLERLPLLLATEGVDFYSLQVGPAAADLQRVTGTTPVIDHTTNIRDFADTAALLMELDLVISVDTAVAHLAGALGRPVWTLLPLVPDWRWGLESETTPWYPTMRLFRQAVSGDWEAVLERVERELRQAVERGRFVK
jgi:tetratricopeptide (TPR) repeat protein